MEGTMFTCPNDALRFVLGGNAVVTLRSIKTEVRYTYRVRLSDDGKLYFVSALTGSNNEADYTYIGVIRVKPDTAQFGLTKGSRMTAESLPVRGFQYMLSALDRGVMPVNVEIWHEGKCGRCGRTLTVPESIASGFGPECITKLAA